MPDLKDLYKAAGVSAGVNAGSGIASSALGFVFNKALMKQQNKYARQMFDLENKRQDWLLLNSAAMQKRALQNAGYSTADPNGTGFSPAPVGNAAAPGTPSMGAADLGRLDLVQARLAAAQAANIEADTEKKKSETEGQDIQNWLNSTYGEKQIQAALANLDANTKKQVEEGLYTAQKKLDEIALTKEQISQIESDIRLDWIKLGPQLQLICAQVYEAEQSGNLKKAQISEVWQDIRESVQRIEKLKSDINVNAAEIALVLQKARLTDEDADAKFYENLQSRARLRSVDEGKKFYDNLPVPVWKAKFILEEAAPLLNIVGKFLR